MKAVFLSTGDEVLHGDIVDTNAAWLGQQLAEHDLALNCCVTLGDELSDLSKELNRLSHEFDLVIVNGGLGPTTDDLSAQAMAAAAGVDLCLDIDWLQKMEDKFSKRNKVMPSSNIKQAMLPAGSVQIDNSVGTACGFYFRLNKAHFYFTPGVPSEFKVMINLLIPKIKKKLGIINSVKRKRYLTFGLSESWLSDRLDPIEWPSGVTLGYRSAMPTIEIKLIAESDSLLLKAEHLLLPHIKDYIVAKDGNSQAQEIVQLLKVNQQSLALAESCTGGLLASNLVAVPGSSSVFSLGVVSYSNQAKIQQLNVLEDIIDEHGAVSLQVVEAMARGVQALAKSDYAIAISGVAGPEGGTVDKPVGTIAFALVTPETCISQIQLLPERGRNSIRELSGALAFDMLRRSISKQDECVEYQFTKLMTASS